MFDISSSSVISSFLYHYLSDVVFQHIFCLHEIADLSQLIETLFSLFLPPHSSTLFVSSSLSLIQFWSHLKFRMNTSTLTKLVYIQVRLHIQIDKWFLLIALNESRISMRFVYAYITWAMYIVYALQWQSFQQYKLEHIVNLLTMHVCNGNHLYTQSVFVEQIKLLVLVWYCMPRWNGHQK